MAKQWHLKYADELIKVDCEGLMDNLNRDADILLKETIHHKMVFLKYIVRRCQMV